MTISGLSASELPARSAHQDALDEIWQAQEQLKAAIDLANHALMQLQEAEDAISSTDGGEEQEAMLAHLLWQAFDDTKCLEDAGSRAQMHLEKLAPPMPEIDIAEEEEESEAVDEMEEADSDEPSSLDA